MTTKDNWRLLPITDKQHSAISKLSARVNNQFPIPTNRGEASDQISKLKKRLLDSLNNELRYREEFEEDWLDPIY